MATNRRTHRWIHLALLALLAIGLTGCGGGGGGGGGGAQGVNAGSNWDEMSWDDGEWE